MEVSSIERVLLSGIAQHLGYSVMPVTRVIKELMQDSLTNVDGAKEKQLIFNQPGREALWLEAEKLMATPIRKGWYADEITTSGPDFLLSNDSVLAEYSMLSEGWQLSYAIGKEQFRNLQVHKNLTIDPQHGRIRIEVWHYNPILLLGKTGLILCLCICVCETKTTSA